MHRLLTAIIGILAIASIALGCGSSGSDDTAEIVTKAQFIKQAEGACAKVVKKREAAGKAWRKEHAGEFVDKFLQDAFERIIAPSAEEKAEALESLTPPPGDEVKIARMIENLEEAGKNLRKEGFDSRPGSAVSEYEREATAYGIQGCASFF